MCVYTHPLWIKNQREFCCTHFWPSTNLLGECSMYSWIQWVLAYFTNSHVLTFHQCCRCAGHLCTNVSFLSKLNSSPLCVYTAVCLSVHLLAGLGCVRVLAIVNNAAVSTGVQVSLWDPAFNSFGYVPRSGAAGSDSNSNLNFLRAFHLFSIVAVPFYIPSSAQWFQFLCVFANAFYFLCVSIVLI